MYGAWDPIFPSPALSPKQYKSLNFLFDSIELVSVSVVWRWVPWTNEHVLLKQRSCIQHSTHPNSKLVSGFIVTHKTKPNEQWGLSKPFLKRKNCFQHECKANGVNICFQMFQKTQQEKQVHISTIYLSAALTPSEEMLSKLNSNMSAFLRFGKILFLFLLIAITNFMGPVVK